MSEETTTGTLIAGGLLREHAPLLAIVPEARIKAGRLPDGVPLPALLVRTVSVVERQTLRGTPKVRSVERVSVTVRAASYREQIAVLKLVRGCLRGWTGDYGGATSIAILTAGTGPDLNGPGDSFEQAQDFRVSFEA